MEGYYFMFGSVDKAMQVQEQCARNARNVWIADAIEYFTLLVMIS